MSNIFPKEESTESLTTRHWEDKFFMYHLEDQMVQISIFLHSTFKDLSNEYSHAQIRVKTKKLWPRQVGEEKQVAVQKLSKTKQVVMTRKLSRDQKNCLDQKSVATKKTISRPACCIATKNAGEN